MKSRKKPFFDGPTPPNLFVGGKGGVITTPAGLAAKLSIQRYHIKNFQIDSNNNISCYIGRNYSMNGAAWLNDNGITYYIDLDGRCTSLGSQAFHNTSNSSVYQTVILPGVTSNSGSQCFGGGGAGTRNKFNLVCVPKLEPIGVTGTTSNNHFSWCDYFGNVYVASGNSVNNLGSPDADITAAISSNIGTWVSYSDNTDIPDKVSGLYTLSATTTSIHIGWDAVTHTNAIDYYILFRDGVRVNANSSTSQNVTGLASATTYEFKVLVIDEMGNNAKKFSDVYSGSTL